MSTSANRSVREGAREDTAEKEASLPPFRSPCLEPSGEHGLSSPWIQGHIPAILGMPARHELWTDNISTSRCHFLLSLGLQQNFLFLNLKAHTLYFLILIRVILFFEWKTKKVGLRLYPFLT